MEGRNSKKVLYAEIAYCLRNEGFPLIVLNGIIAKKSPGIFLQWISAVRIAAYAEKGSCLLIPTCNE
jgi:hypothetical protein